jgi:molybdopterin converting factor small subunit
MIEVTVKVMGGQSEIVELDEGSTVQQLSEQLNHDGKYMVKVNKNLATYETKLSDLDVVVFSEKIKGA